ncbi:MAG: tyrosine-type recombinase/integrase [Actinomycetota bacterium]|nr:tyrosine-type recombinase/integrase [Actinomycetota bacterium]
MRNYIESFLAYMKIEKMASPVTIYGYRIKLKKFFDFLSSKNISDLNLISTRTVRQYFYQSKENRGLCQSSVSKIIATVKSFFNYLGEEDSIVENPTRKIRATKKKNKIPFVMSKYEVDLIIRSVDFAPYRYRKNNTRDKLFLSLLYYTGIRRSELLNLDWTDINLSMSTVTIRFGKGGKDRLIPLHKEVTRPLDKYLMKDFPLRPTPLSSVNKEKGCAYAVLGISLICILPYPGLRKRAIQPTASGIVLLLTWLKPKSIFLRF